MKRLLYSVLLVLCGAVWSAQAASRLFPDEHHFVSLWGNVGYPYLITNTDLLKPSISVAPAIGAGYRYYRNGFILQAGIEGEFEYITNRVNNNDFTFEMVDTEGDDFIMHAMVDKCKDVIQLFNCYVPVYVGYEYRRFYFLAGAKVGINLYGSTSTSSLISTKAEYERYMGWLENMPNHDLQNDVLVKSDTYKLMVTSPSVVGHLEIGGRLGSFSLEKGADVPKSKYRFYISAYADYGILNMHQNDSRGDGITYKQPAGEAIQFSVLPSMLSNQMLDKQVHPLTIGVKFTCLFEFPGKQICVMCKD